MTWTSFSARTSDHLVAAVLNGTRKEQEHEGGEEEHEPGGVTGFPPDAQRAPIVRDRARAGSISWSWTDSCTINRDPAMQVWPVAANTPRQGRGRGFEVGVRKDDLRALSAELESRAV
jgi:hypothetical protein